MTSPLPPPLQAPSEALNNLTSAIGAYAEAPRNSDDLPSLWLDMICKLMAYTDDSEARATEALRAENARLLKDRDDWKAKHWKAHDDFHRQFLEITSITAHRDRLEDGLEHWRGIADKMTTDSGSLRAQLQESAEREKGLREALERIRSGIPACSQEGCLYIAHFDQDGTETGIEQVDPLAVIQSIVGLVDSALTAHPPQTAGEKET